MEAVLDFEFDETFIPRSRLSCGRRRGSPSEAVQVGH